MALDAFAIGDSGSEQPNRGSARSDALHGLSHQLWGLSWSKYLPYAGSEAELTFVSSSFDRASPFVSAHFPTIFEEEQDRVFTQGRLAPAKRRYYRAVGDFFELHHRSRTVGLVVCAPVDWSTYYIRMAAALPEYQGQGTIPEFLVWMFGRLAEHGVERVQADAAPSNFASMRALLKMGFNVTGNVLTERWGAHVQLTKFLDRDCEEVFLRQFCSGVRYQREDLRPRRVS